MTSSNIKLRLYNLLYYCLFIAGLQYDTITHTLNDEVYTVGLHLGPPGYRFIKFPNVYKTILFPVISCLNKDGITIIMQVQFQYLVSMKKQDLRHIILEFINHDHYKEVLQ